MNDMESKTMHDLHTIDELLACLREAPHLRIVGYDDHDARVVIEGGEDDNGEVVYYFGGRKIIVRIAKGSAADALLDDAYNAAAPDATDAALWASLPVRYGPGCSEWCLPEHPEATQAFPGQRGVEVANA